MSLVDHLMAERTPLELAKELAATAKENATLRERVVRLECEMFWLRDARTKPPELFPGQDGTVQQALAVIDAARLRRQERERSETDRRQQDERRGVPVTVTVHSDATIVPAGAVPHHPV